MHEAGDDTAAPNAEATGGVTWMTYREIAAARGITHAAAIRLVQRRRWQKREGSNDGLAHVLVPPDALPTPPGRRPPVKPIQPPPSSPPMTPPDTAAFETALTAIREAHAGETAALREQLATVGQERDGIRSERDHERARAARAEAGREAEREHAVRAEQGRDSERARADALRDRLTMMQEQLADAHAALQAAELAETRIATAEGRADRAEQAIAGERARADAVRARLDAVHAQLAAEEAAADQARRQAQAARDNAETLREADAARKSKGPAGATQSSVARGMRPAPHLSII